eukprot:gene8348-biopygen4624
MSASQQLPTITAEVRNARRTSKRSSLARDIDAPQKALGEQDTGAVVARVWRGHILFPLARGRERHLAAEIGVTLRASVGSPCAGGGGGAGGWGFHFCSNESSGTPPAVSRAAMRLPACARSGRAKDADGCGE